MKQIGRNGRLLIGSYGTAIVGAAGTTGPKIPAPGANVLKLYLVKSVGTNSAIRVEPNHFLPVKGTAVTSLVAGDVVVPVDVATYCPATQWGFDPTQDTLDVTSQCDAGYNKGIPSGWSNAEGNLTAFFDDENPAQEKMIRQFFYTVTISANGATITAEKATPTTAFVLQMYDDVQTSGKARKSYVMGININKISLTTNIKEARNFETPFTLAPEGNPTRIIELV